LNYSPHPALSREGEGKQIEIDKKFPPGWGRARWGDFLRLSQLQGAGPVDGLGPAYLVRTDTARPLVVDGEKEAN
jgi:hypothetical protein